MIRRRLVLVSLLAGVLIGTSATAVALTRAPSTTRTATGSTTKYAYETPLGIDHFYIYTPSGYSPKHPVPLVVVTHGCNTTALQQQASTNYDQLAERHNFIVMYPDDDDLAHPIKCWRFYDPTNEVPGLSFSDVAIVAGMTRATMQLRNVDRERVYEIGMSSGALLTSDLAAAYPDLFTAIGIMAGGPYEAATCLSGDGSAVVPGVPSVGLPYDEAVGAYNAEGDHNRVIPFIVLNGDADHTVAPGCDDQAVQQWLRTDNLVLDHRQAAPLSLAPHSDVSRRVHGGRAYKILSYTEPSGCLIGEHYVIHGMGHFWSGGSANPAYSAFTDPTGPSAAVASWNFFDHYRLSLTGGQCATATSAW